MANNFLILELGTDIKDSKTFKQIMETRHGGRDLTPKCVPIKIQKAEHLLTLINCRHLHGTIPLSKSGWRIL